MTFEIKMLSLTPLDPSNSPFFKEKSGNRNYLLNATKLWTERKHEVKGWFLAKEMNFCFTVTSNCIFAWQSLNWRKWRNKRKRMSIRKVPKSDCSQNGMVAKQWSLFAVLALPGERKMLKANQEYVTLTKQTFWTLSIHKTFAAVLDKSRFLVFFTVLNFGRAGQRRVDFWVLSLLHVQWWMEIFTAWNEKVLPYRQAWCGPSCHFYVISITIWSVGRYPVLSTEMKQ